MNGNNQHWDLSWYIITFKRLFFVVLDLRLKANFHDADISRGVGLKSRTTFNFSLQRTSPFLHHPIKLDEFSEYSSPRGTSASWKLYFISRGLRIGRIFAYGRISTLNNGIKKKRKKSKIRFTFYLVFFYEYLWKISMLCHIKRNPLLIAILRIEFHKDC